MLLLSARVRHNFPGITPFVAVHSNHDEDLLGAGHLAPPVELPGDVSLQPRQSH
jgi:hypothetical protein